MTDDMIKDLIKWMAENADTTECYECVCRECKNYNSGSNECVELLLKAYKEKRHR